MNLQSEGGSFRDRSGQIFYLDNRVLRTVTSYAVDDFNHVRDTGLTRDLISRNMLIAENQLDIAEISALLPKASIVLEHPRIPFISHPYEWPFSALKDAALLYLDIHLQALERGVSLSDASAYNVQFIGCKPVFIDSLSFRKYSDGELWTGHRQFCEQFLNPLLLTSLTGVSHHAWYRGTLEGISTLELNAIVPWYKKLTWNKFTQIYLHSLLQNPKTKNHQAASRTLQRKLPLIGLKQMLRSMRNWVSNLHLPKRMRSDWGDYTHNHLYSHPEVAAKREFIADFVSQCRPDTLWDIGCNTGDYARLALAHGAKYVVGFDFDAQTVEKAFCAAKNDSSNFLPLVADLTNPSPSQGWLENERKGLMARANPNGILALALIHHLIIGKNIPLEQAVGWLVELAPEGIIEFIEKSDPMIQRMLSLRTDIFDNYNKANFENILCDRATVIKSKTVTDAGRTLYWYKRS